MNVAKKLFRRIVGAVTVAATVITLSTPQNMIAFAAEDDMEVLWTKEDYNDIYYNSYDEAVNACKEINDKNKATDIKDGYITDDGELVDIPVFSDLDSAAAYVRRCMVERRSEIDIIYKTNARSNYQYENDVESILSKALEETGNGYEGDYLRWHLGAYEAKVGKVNIGKYANGYNRYVFILNYITTKAQEDVVTSKINNLKSTTFSDWASRSEYYNIERVYKWVCNNFTYDNRIYNAKGKEDHSAYGGLVNGVTVCQGYATTMYRILKEMGISNRVVASRTHGWNIVKVGSKYYNLDATWGDTNDNNAKYGKEFLLVSERNISVHDIEGEHTRASEKSFVYPLDITSEGFNAKYPMATTNYVATSSDNNRVSSPNVGVGYETHVQDFGWRQGLVYNGTTSGTVGLSKRLEAIRINLNNKGNLDLGVEYKTHVQDYGWESGWARNGGLSGTSGQSKRLEAIRIRLTGKDAEKYDIYYRVHAQDYGWLGWAKDGEEAGTAGHSKRLEAIQIKVVKRGTPAPSASTGYSFVDFNYSTIHNVGYTTHVQDYGWQNYVSDGELAGTTGQSKRLEGISIRLGTNQLKSGRSLTGSIEYRTHVQNYGWETAWRRDGAVSGTMGKSLRLEAIEIRLTGEIANYADVYYCVHAQDYGWLGWAKNGEPAGTAGLSKRLEGIRIELVPKGSGAPSSIAKPAFVSK